MKVLALVSGGKDSCYNALLCEQYGHTVVALGNLYPDDPSVDELDSYMYQTVGHTLIEAYSACSGLPLFRKKILGTSVEQGLIYSGTQGDEVEDLALLLMYAKECMPEITAVSSGAIASDYQRSRVEHVCARLGLVSLAYLWHQPQSALLKRMIDSQIDARLVKVAAAGLHPSKHVGASLPDMSRYLHQLRDVYGINVCGEGGEYETLTLDCPLFHYGRIVLDTSEVVVAVEDSMAPVAWLKPVSFHIEKKGDEEKDACIIEVPDAYRGVRNTKQPLDVDTDVPGVVIEVEGGRQNNAYGWCHGYCIKKSEDVEIKDEGELCRAFSLLLSRIQERIGASGLSIDHGVFCTLFVSDMTHFGRLNDVYSNFFPSINPPSRATLELGGNSSILIAIHVLCANTMSAHGDVLQRRVLHVQSISEWAPSCIGPYSQATSYDGIVRFAGQIALDPPTLHMVTGGMEQEVERVSRTCSLVGAAMKLEFKSTMLWSILYISDDVLNNHRTMDTFERLFRGDGGVADQEEEEYLSVTHPASPCGIDLPMLPLIMVLKCPKLPRGAMIELQSINVGPDVFTYQSDSSSDDEAEPDSRAWFAGLEYAAPNMTDCFEIHTVFCPAHVMKVNMIHKGGAMEESVDGIPAAIHTCLSMASLSLENIVQVHCYIDTSLSGYKGFESAKKRIHECLASMGCMQAFTVPTSGVWLASNLTGESSMIGLELFAKR